MAKESKKEGPNLGSNLEYPAKEEIKRALKIAAAREINPAYLRDACNSHFNLAFNYALFGNAFNNEDWTVDSILDRCVSYFKDCDLPDIAPVNAALILGEKIQATSQAIRGILRPRVIEALRKKAQNEVVPVANELYPYLVANYSNFQSQTDQSQAKVLIEELLKQELIWNDSPFRRKLSLYFDACNFSAREQLIKNVTDLFIQIPPESIRSSKKRTNSLSVALAPVTDESLLKSPLNKTIKVNDVPPVKYKSRQRGPEIILETEEDKAARVAHRVSAGKEFLKIAAAMILGFTSAYGIGKYTKQDSSDQNASSAHFSPTKNKEDHKKNVYPPAPVFRTPQIDPKLTQKITVQEVSLKTSSFIVPNDTRGILASIIQFYGQKANPKQRAKLQELRESINRGALIYDLQALRSGQDEAYIKNVHARLGDAKHIHIDEQKYAQDGEFFAKIWKDFKKSRNDNRFKGRTSNLHMGFPGEEISLDANNVLIKKLHEICPDVSLEELSAWSKQKFSANQGKANFNSDINSFIALEKNLKRTGSVANNHDPLARKRASNQPTAKAPMSASEIAKRIQQIEDEVLGRKK